MTKTPPTKRNVTMYYVATRACYVLVEAETDTQARHAGRAALYDRYANLCGKFVHDVPIDIQTVRPATADEIELWKWHHEMAGHKHTSSTDQQLS